jgi:hypothetical protein
MGFIIMNSYQYGSYMMNKGNHMGVIMNNYQFLFAKLGYNSIFFVCVKAETL